jgi:hypothetical protein
VNELPHPRLEKGGLDSEWHYHTTLQIERMTTVFVDLDGVHFELWEDGDKKASRFLDYDEVYSLILEDR